MNVTLSSKAEKISSVLYFKKFFYYSKFFAFRYQGKRNKMEMTRNILIYLISE